MSLFKAVLTAAVVLGASSGICRAKKYSRLCLAFPDDLDGSWGGVKIKTERGNTIILEYAAGKSVDELIKSFS